MADNRIISRLGSNIHYWVEGPEKGPVIVFSHGATLDHHSFDNQVSALVALGYRVVTWDMRGHGMSTPMGPEITVEILADDLMSIINELGFKKVTLVGHSFGGYVVQKFIYKHPERVNAIVIIGCTNIAQKSRVFNRIMYRIMPKILKGMELETFRKRTLADLSLRDTVKSYASKAMKHISKEDFIAIIMAGTAALWLESDIPENYTIPAPFLLTHGDSDHANGGIFHKQSPKWAAQESNCRYEIIHDAGHTAQMDNPKVFNKALIEFLQKNINV